MIKVIDNFFNNPNEVTSFARQQIFYNNINHPDAYSGRWIGMRTENISKLDPEFYDYLIECIKSKFALGSDQVILYFHYLQENDKYSKGWEHKDSNAFKYAGVVYLNESPVSKCGTLIRDEGEVIVNNEFNRAVIYDSSLTHSALGGFGKTCQDARLTLTIFVR